MEPSELISKAIKTINKITFQNSKNVSNSEDLVQEYSNNERSR
jgi:hypothetical protein